MESVPADAIPQTKILGNAMKHKQKLEPFIDTTKRPVSRRTIVKGAAWSVPVVALAVASPAAAASTVDVGALKLTADCGIVGFSQGFELTASTTAAIPAGTTITITASGLLDATLDFSSTDSGLTISALSNGSQVVTLTSPLAAGSTISFGSDLSIGVLWSATATLALPTGYTATGGDTTASFEVLATGLCFVLS